MSSLRDLSIGRRDILSIPLDKITIDEKFNVREDYGDIDELAKSIAESGQREPGKVRQSENAAILVDGHRRLKAIQIANEKYGASVKAFLCYPEERGVNEETRVLDMLLLNDGKPLTVIEQATAVKRLLDFQWKEADIAKKLGKSVSYIHSLLTLNGATAALRKAVRDNLISPTAAIKLAAVSEAKQTSILERIATLENGPVEKKTKGKAVKVSDVEKATKGSASLITAKSIKDKIKEVENHEWKHDWNCDFRNGVKFGLELALGTQELPQENKVAA